MHPAHKEISNVMKTDTRGFYTPCMVLVLPVQIWEIAPGKLVPRAKAFDFAAAHEDKPRRTTLYVYPVPQFGIFIVALFEHRDKTISEEGLAICHVTPWTYRQHAVMREPNIVIFVIERVAVFDAYRAMCSPAHVYDDLFAIVGLAEGGEELVETEPMPWLAGRGAETYAIAVVHEHAFENLYMRHLNACGLW